MRGLLPGSATLLAVVNAAVSLALLSGLFAAIYKILPDRRIAWRDVMIGALFTAALFTLGKSMIGLYVGGAGIAGSFGAAGSLAAVLVWIYYSAVIFLLGAEFTRAWANRAGSRQATPVPAKPPQPQAHHRRARATSGDAHTPRGHRHRAGRADRRAAVPPARPRRLKRRRRRPVPRTPPSTPSRTGRKAYFVICATTPAPTVRPPSRMAKRSPSSIAIGAISSTSIETLSPGITISTPSGSVTTPVTSVVRK